MSAAIGLSTVLICLAVLAAVCISKVEIIVNWGEDEE